MNERHTTRDRNRSRDETKSTRWESTEETPLDRGSRFTACGPPFDSTTIAQPKTTGTVVLNDYPLDALLDTIDWMPFFNAWEFSGKFPDILNDPRKGPEARKLYDDAQIMLDKIIDERWLRADAVAGCFPAYSDGNSIVILDPNNHELELLERTGSGSNARCLMASHSCA